MVEIRLVGSEGGVSTVTARAGRLPLIGREL